MEKEENKEMKCGDRVTYTLFRKEWEAYLEVYSKKEIRSYGNTPKPHNFNDIMATEKMEQIEKTLLLHENEEKGYYKHTTIQDYDITVGIGIITAMKTTKEVRGQLFELPQEIYRIEVTGVPELPHQPNVEFKCHKNKLVIYEYAPVYRRMQMDFEHSVCVKVPGRNRYEYTSDGMTIEYDV